jgi:IclR family pca regulon transcriptional regulator
VREQGYAWVDGEFDAAFCGLSVPIRDDQGQVAAALSVNLLSGETTEAKAKKRLLGPLREAAQRLRAMAPNFLGSVARSTSRQTMFE